MGKFQTLLRDSGIPGAFKPKKLGYSTFQFIDADGAENIQHHKTVIVRKLANGQTVLNSGGHRSMTTKEKINQYSGYQVNARDGLWYVSGAQGSCLFYDGMILPDAFRAPKDDSDITAHNVAMKKRIKKFVELIDGKNNPKPSSGDCWLCCMRTADGKPALGDDTGHLLEHLQEGYLHGSLIVNALREYGIHESAFGFWFFDQRMTRNAVRKYLTKRLCRVQ